jgi:hypothetical protein
VGPAVPLHTLVFGHVAVDGARSLWLSWRTITPLRLRGDDRGASPDERGARW